jgi:hypothetical protein
MNVYWRSEANVSLEFQWGLIGCVTRCLQHEGWSKETRCFLAIESPSIRYRVSIQSRKMACTVKGVLR